jgi:BirA family transcriptional regulator, biotin operon repressor / biotin---[acetyl-CoA-carboxylase] ligase
MIRQLHLDSCDSTQDILKEQLQLIPNEKLLVSCEHQLKGRGRGQNTWSDYCGTVNFSMNLLPHHISSFTAIELAVIICLFFKPKGVHLRLKWPNDVINTEGKKCAGILIQNLDNSMLAGVGINIFHQEQDFGGCLTEVTQLDKKKWAHELADFIHGHRYENTEQLTQDWMNLCCHLQQSVRISDGKIIIDGKFIGLGEYGQALIETEDGLTQCFNGSLRLI